MFSIEPGFYQEGSFGIRIESILLVKPVTLEVRKYSHMCRANYGLHGSKSDLCIALSLSMQNNFNNVGYLGFEPVTLVRRTTDMMHDTFWRNSHNSVYYMNMSVLPETIKHSYFPYFTSEIWKKYVTRVFLAGPSWLVFFACFLFVSSLFI